MLCNLIPLHHLKHGVNCCPDKRVAAVGRPVITRRQRLFRHTLSHQECSHRNTASKRLRAGHNVRFHTVVLPCEHLAGAPHAALDLI